MGVGSLSNYGDFNNSVALGNIPHIVHDNLFGFNLDVDMGTAEDVWAGGGNYPGFPLGAPEPVRITSTAVADAQNGIGAHSYFITGLETSTSEAYTTEFLLAHPTNGTTPVVSTKSWYRVSQVFVATAGTSGTAQGVITCQHNVTLANIFGTIPLGYNRTQAAIITVPANNLFNAQEGSISVGLTGGGNTEALVSGMVRTPGGVFQAVFSYLASSSKFVRFDFGYLGRVPPGSDIKFRVQNVTANNTIVTCSLNFIFNRLT